MRVSDALRPLVHVGGLRHKLLVAGGCPDKQIDALAKGIDLLRCHPGRLVDLMDRGAVHLDKVEITILDEADHMADMGFRGDDEHPRRHPRGWSATALLRHPGPRRRHPRREVR